MRTRSFNSLAAVDSGYRYLSCGSTTDNPSPPMFFGGVLRSMTDEVTPNFSKRSREGAVIINPMTSETKVYTAQGTPGKFKATGLVQCSGYSMQPEFDLYGLWLPYYMDLNGSYVSGYTPASCISNSDRAAAVAEATTKAWEESRQAMSEILTDLAEFKQTLSLLRSPFDSALRLATRMRDGARKRGGGLNAMTQEYLRYRYGWRPLMGSIEGTLQAMRKPYEARRQTVRGNSSAQNATFSTGSTTYGGGNYTFDIDTRSNLTVRAGILLDGEATLASRLGLDLGGVMSLPWELVPYSFVVDWFANVSSYLQAMGALLTADTLGSWLVTEETTTFTVGVTSTTGITSPGRTVLRASSEGFTIQRTVKTRIPQLGNPSLSLRPDLLSIRDWSHTLDAAALTYQRLRGR